MYFLIKVIFFTRVYYFKYRGNNFIDGKKENINTNPQNVDLLVPPSSMPPSYTLDINQILPIAELVKPSNKGIKISNIGEDEYFHKKKHKLMKNKKNMRIDTTSVILLAFNLYL